MEKDDLGYIDARDGFLDLYRSVIKYKDKKRISFKEYYYINEAIEYARKALCLLDRAEADEEGYLPEQRDMIRERLDDLLRMKKYFSFRVVYKPAKKIRKRKKDKEQIEIERFYKLRKDYIERCYARAVMIEKEDIISMTQYADLSDSVELGEAILEEANKIEGLNKDKRYLEDRLRLIKAFNDIREIRRLFFEGPKNVFVDDEWIK